MKPLRTERLTTPPSAVSDAAWLEVLTAVDQTYAEMMRHQARLEAQNAELTDMRQRMASMLSSVSDILIVVDRQGRIEEHSASLVQRMNCPDASLAGQEVASLFSTGGSEALRRVLARHDIGNMPEVIEVTLAAPEPMEYEIALSPRFDARRRLIGHVLIGREVGELRRAYAALARSHDELKTAQTLMVRNEKLASLGRLLAGVAHELNNPISFVYANAHALERYAAKIETYFERVLAGAPREELVALRDALKLERDLGNLREAVRGAREGAERVRGIVDDLRRLSADGAGEPEDFDLAEIARIAAHWVTCAPEAGGTLEFRGAARLMARGRPGHIQQVIMNLVQNARDAVAGRSDGHIVVTLGSRDGMAVIEIADNGPGIAPAHQVAVFDPFFTTKPVGQGTGLGLAISHKIAQEHGGRLLLCSEHAGPGACFRLELPLAGTEGHG